MSTRQKRGDRQAELFACSTKPVIAIEKITDCTAGGGAGLDGTRGGSSTNQLSRTAAQLAAGAPSA
jgi:hypothetical protein